MSRIRITRHIGMIRRLSCSIQTVYRGIPVKFPSTDPWILQYEAKIYFRIKLRLHRRE